MLLIQQNNKKNFYLDHVIFKFHFDGMTSYHSFNPTVNFVSILFAFGLGFDMAVYFCSFLNICLFVVFFYGYR